MNDRKTWIGAAAIVAGLIVVGLLGVNLPVPEMPEERAIRYGTVNALRVLHELNGQGAVDFDSTLNVDGASTLAALTTDGAMDFSSTLNVDGATTLNSTLDVDGNITSGTGGITMTDNVIIDGAADAIQLVAQGYTTQTNNIAVVESSAGTDYIAVGGTGLTTFSGVRDATSGYDYLVLIDGEFTGQQNGAKTYGMQISLNRPNGTPTTGGDLDDAGLKIRVDNDESDNIAGYVLRGLDVQAKNDDAADHPSVSTLSGASISAQTDHSSGESYTADAYALQASITANARVTQTLITGDFRMFRQAATEPTTENVVRIRNSNTSGTGVDAGLAFTSDGSGETDDFDYVIDMNSADVDDADIRLSNGETIKNTTDTAIQLSGFFALEEGTVIDLASGGTITPTASYQPITNATGGSIDTSATTAIADGPVAGAILVICNEDAQNVVVKDAANTQLGGDITLTGGADDCLTLLWDGTDWTALAFHDN